MDSQTLEAVKLAQSDTDEPSSQLPESETKILYLAGSCVSDFYYELSLVYAREKIQVPGCKSYYAIIHPDGLWQIGTCLNGLSEKMNLASFLVELPQVDLVVPLMFCLPGMTTYRAFFEDMLGIPVVGSTSECTSLAANKAKTRSVVSSAGVKVAEAQLITRGGKVTIQPPLVIKPNSADNSLGLTLVRREEEIESALEAGFEHDDVLLAEKFIPGRELRIAVVERNDGLYIPPIIEYLVSEQNPIRTTDDKYKISTNGTPEAQSQKSPVTPVCPAQVEPEILKQISEAAKKCHVALGCRDYSLYDFRIHQDTGEPYLLEAGLFWAFAKNSMISKMILAEGHELEKIVREVWSRAARRVRIPCGSILKYSSGCV